MTAPSDPPSIAVIGAGGVGGLLAALLARAGHDVRLLARGAALSESTIYTRMRPLRCIATSSTAGPPSCTS